jgi:hypothetical protein
MNKIFWLTLFALLCAVPVAHAQEKTAVFRTVYQGPPNYSGDTIIGSDPAGGYDKNIALVPFKVKAPAILVSVVMPMKGQDMIVQLATGPNMPPDTGRGDYIREPEVVVSKKLPGNTPFAVHEIPMPGNYKLIPGKQYFLMLSAENLGSRAGTWTGDYRAQDRVGGRIRGKWFVSPGNHPGALSLVIYGTPVKE